MSENHNEFLESIEAATRESGLPFSDADREFWLAVDAAKRNGLMIVPADIGALLKAFDWISAVEIANGLKAAVGILSIGDELALTEELVILARALVDNVNFLADVGKIGDAARGIGQWPINYAPHGGDGGAAGWTRARKRYDSLHCGEGALFRAEPQARGETGGPSADHWARIARAGKKAIELARRRLGEFAAAREHASSFRDYRITVAHGGETLRQTYYLQADGQVWLIPDWLLLCRKGADEHAAIRRLVDHYLLGDESALIDAVRRAVGQTAVSKLPVSGEAVETVRKAVLKAFDAVVRADPLTSA